MNVSLLPALCEGGFFHFMPYAIPIITDPVMNELSPEGVSTRRLNHTEGGEDKITSAVLAR